MEDRQLEAGRRDKCGQSVGGCLKKIYISLYANATSPSYAKSFKVEDITGDMPHCLPLAEVDTLLPCLCLQKSIKATMQ